ncbi:maleylacetoacetate isomerase [Rhizobium leguminosarum]|uniref:maleylacetoacetate isomerase n=1 Tax=Rhizobium leguminosarum TaxID=384 RepID=UPI001441FD71|nr:maleylacetoacetate isomerase [Rhizobium leguminosarum]MBY5868693.1 maleylacetoacetate isomerase [Rhizobium leguminosarum]NKM08768.1 maleylacetoacetate isomerase [Rhizobium leguminosarum bv. viciae]
MQTILHDYWRSSASYRVRIGLNLLGLPYRSVSVDLLGGGQRSADYLACNPQGLVPALEIDGVILTQSLAILEYLNETHAAGWLGSALLEKARIRALAYAIAMEVHPVCNLRVARYAVSLGGTTLEDWMKHFIRDGLADFEAMLAQNKRPTQYCHGGLVSLADICLVPQVYNATRWNVDMAEFPKTAAIAARLEILEAFADAHPDRASPKS